MKTRHRVLAGQWACFLMMEFWVARGDGVPWTLREEPGNPPPPNFPASRICLCLSPIIGNTSNNCGHPALHTNDAVVVPDVRDGTQIPVKLVIDTDTSDEGPSDTIDKVNSMI